MLLRTRITLLVVLSAAGLWAMFTSAFYLRDQELTQHLHEALLQTQQVAWKQHEDDALAELRQGLRSVLDQPAWEVAWRGQDSEALGKLLGKWLALHPGWRADIYDARHNLIYTNGSEVRQVALVGSGWVDRALGQTGPLEGLSQVSRSQYSWVVSQRMGDIQRLGVLALGLDVASRLESLSHTLQAEAFLVNLRGREVAGTQSGLLEQLHQEFAIRKARVDEMEAGADGGRRHWSVGTLPLRGPDERQVGALLVLRDVQARHEADNRINALALAAGGLLLLALGGAAFVYLRVALAPLERSVDVLARLAQGDLRSALDEADEAKDDEAGQIARGVAVLRAEMLNLQMLRDERVRTRQQQERLIRNQLMHLAGSLDEASRSDILRALESSGRGESDEGRGQGNELVELAGILGRMSGLVTSQQDRLVQLLRELQASMEQQALLVSLQQELEIARNMQLSILPRNAPTTNAVELSALMIPAKEIGGDFYDYFFLDETRLALVVADVSGKGVPAAFFMAISRTLLKSNALLLRNPAEVIGRLNDQLSAENEQMMFVTVFFGILDLSTGECVFVNAGHNPPLVHSAASGRITPLQGPRNMALAVMEDQVFGEGRLQMSVGDTLLLYTDGVTEATNAQGALFGESALEQVLGTAATGTAPWPAAVLAAVRQFEAGVAQADDITCVSVCYRGPG